MKQAPFFIIDNGLKRGFTNWQTFDRVFRPARVWIQDPHADLISDGATMPDWTIIVRNANGTWFLIDRDDSGSIIKRGIPGMELRSGINSVNLPEGHTRFRTSSWRGSRTD